MTSPVLPPTPAPEYLEALAMEIRTHLNDILGPAQLLRGELGRNNANVEQILGAGRRLLEVAEGLTENSVAAAPAAALPVTSAAKTVLYFEDNAANFLLVQRILKRRPHIRLLHVTHGATGLELVRQDTPDLILLDLNLPDTHGSEVLTKLLAEEGTRDIPVVVLSADASARQIDRLLALGARNYLTKPLGVDRLLAVVDESLA